MFSISCVFPHVAVYQTQPSSFSVIQASNFPKQREQFYKSQRCCQSSHGSSSRNPAFSTPRHSLSTSSEIIDEDYDVFHADSTLSNQSADSSTLGSWLQSCSSIKEIRRIHAVVLRCTKHPVVFVDNNLISAYVKFGDLVAARGVFDGMTEKNVVSWTAMLNGYERFGMDEKALKLFSEFVDKGFQWNSKTFVIILNVCCKTFDYDLGQQVHACMIKRGLSSLILDSVVLHLYAQCSDLEGAFRVFDRMKTRDVISWTTMITACSQHRQEHEAFVMFSQMLLDGFDPNEFTVCSLLNACGEEKQLSLGRQLHCAVVKKVYHMDIFVGTALVDMYAKCGIIEDSRMLFDGMKRKNAVTWTSIIAGYARNGLGEEAIRLFRLMKLQRIIANNLTMVSILRACGLLKAIARGKEVHAHILKNFAPNNIYIGSALVWLYCKCSEYSAASKVLEYLPDKDVVSWTAMISGCARLGHEYEALEYLKQMLGTGVDPNPFTYSSALKACAKLENIKQGKLIHSSINKTPALSNVFVGSALINMYSKCGHLVEAVQVFDSMPKRNVVAWKAMIVAYAKNGLCGEALKLMYRMEAEGIEVDDYILSTILTACGDFHWDDQSSSKHCLQC